MNEFTIEVTALKAQEAGRKRAELYFRMEELAYQTRLKELQIQSIEPTAEEACDCPSCSGWGRNTCPYCESDRGADKGYCLNCGGFVEP